MEIILYLHKKVVKDKIEDRPVEEWTCRKKYQDERISGYKAKPRGYYNNQSTSRIAQTVLGGRREVGA